MSLWPCFPGRYSVHPRHSRDGDVIVDGIDDTLLRLVPRGSRYKSVDKHPRLRPGSGDVSNSFPVSGLRRHP
eukprot:1515553-Amphidinium_carterae.1